MPKEAVRVLRRRRVIVEDILLDFLERNQGMNMYQIAKA